MQKTMINVAGGLLGQHCPGTVKDLEKNERFVRVEQYETFSLVDIPTWNARKAARRSL